MGNIIETTKIIKQSEPLRDIVTMPDGCKFIDKNGVGHIITHKSTNFFDPSNKNHTDHHTYSREWKPFNKVAELDLVVKAMKK